MNTLEIALDNRVDCTLDTAQHQDTVKKQSTNKGH